MRTSSCRVRLRGVRLVERDTGRDFIVASGIVPYGVEVADRVERTLPVGRRNAVLTLEIEDGLRTGQERDSLVCAREEATAPDAGAVARASPSGLERHEAGQVFGFAAETVGPGRPPCMACSRVARESPLSPRGYAACGK